MPEIFETHLPPMTTIDEDAMSEAVGVAGLAFIGIANGYDVSHIALASKSECVATISGDTLLDYRIMFYFASCCAEHLFDPTVGRLPPPGYIHEVLDDVRVDLDRNETDCPARLSAIAYCQDYEVELDDAVARTDDHTHFKQRIQVALQRNLAAFGNSGVRLALHSVAEALLARKILTFEEILEAIPDVDAVFLAIATAREERRSGEDSIH